MKDTCADNGLPEEPFPKKVKASRSAVKVMLAVFWDAEGNILADYFACRHKHEPIILFRSHKVSKAGNGKEKKKQASKRTCPSPPRQCTATSGRRRHGNNRGMRPPTSWTSILFPWLRSLRHLSIPWNEEATERPSLWRQRRYLCRHRGVAFSSTTPLLLWRTFQGQEQMAEMYIFGWWLGWEIKVSMQKI